MAYNRDEGNRYVIPIDGGKEFITRGGAGARCKKPSSETKPSMGGSAVDQYAASARKREIEFWSDAFLWVLGAFLTFTNPLTGVIGIAFFGGLTVTNEPVGITEPVFCDPHAGVY